MSDCDCGKRGQSQSRDYNRCVLDQGCDDREWALSYIHGRGEHILRCHRRYTCQIMDLKTEGGCQIIISLMIRVRASVVVNLVAPTMKMLVGVKLMALCSSETK